jgi:FSR family fosmidomycin resistance protein-like MFS transporter
VQSGPPTPPSPRSERAEAVEIGTIAGGHFVHDTYTAFIPPLLPVLQERLALGYTQAAWLAIFPQIASLLNPLIGYLADRVSLRYFVILAPAVTATLVTLLGQAPSYLAMAMLLLALGVSVAALHAPAPAMIGHLAGRRVGTAMSVFMAAGELGRTLGPVVVVWGIETFMLEGLWRLAFVGWAVSGILFWRLRHAAPARASVGMEFLPWDRARRLFPALAALLLTRTLMVGALTVFLPTFVTDVRGGGLWLAAAALTLLEGAGVVGALFSGTLSDRWGRVPLLVVLSVLAPLLLLAFLVAPAWATIPLLLGLGLTAISPTPVFLALVQDTFAEHRALANGTFLALNFLTRALGIWGVGLIADALGMQSAFLWGALVGLLALPALVLLARSLSVSE